EPAAVVPGLVPPPAAPADDVTPVPAADSGLVAFAPVLPENTPAAEAPAAAAVPQQPASDVVATAAAEASESAYRRAAIEEDAGVDSVQLHDLLMTVLDRGGSDLHLTAGARPMIRLHGSLQPLEEQPILTPPVIQRM